MLAVGWHFRGAGSARLTRGAQALWLAGCLLSGLSFVVILDEAYAIDWVERGPTDPLFLSSCLLTTGVAGIAFALLPGIPQSIAFHLCGGVSLVSFLGWLDYVLPPFDHFYENLGVLALYLVAGGLWLALAAGLRVRGRHDLAIVSRLFGALAILGSSFVLATDEYAASWQQIAMDAIAFLFVLAFIAASVKRQSQVFMYSGGAFLLLWIIYLHYERFEEAVAMPVALLIGGALMIGLGLGVGRPGKRTPEPE
jgi:hypothetical protein